ncbi:MAG: diacylglycerol kinase family lipid kinase [Bacteroidales bacterium]|nr:diacylglycerol kinase family lipid kinase [Bacteroidales bacterium]
MNTEWMAIINPSSGGGISEQKWTEIQHQLSEQGFQIQYYFTEKHFSTIEKVKNIIESGFDHLLVLGGDGTVNEVVNGIMLQKRYPSKAIHLGIIPIGTGNDWIRTIGIPNDIAAAIQIIKAGKVIHHDVGWATFQTHSQEEKRFFINTAGTGLDSIVVEKTNQQKLRSQSSAIAYMMNLLKAFLRYRPMDVQIEADNGIKISGKMIDFAVGIGRYNGGGMLPFPQANPCDGLFDVIFIRNMSKLKMLFCFSKLFKGTLSKVREVHCFQTKKIAFHSSESVFLETDGETLGYDPFTFGICSQVLTIFSPASF